MVTPDARAETGAVLTSPYTLRTADSFSVRTRGAGWPPTAQLIEQLVRVWN
jgi:hypothetical protein